MAVGGFATAGGSGLGQSRAFRTLPWANYRSVSDWLEELVDAMGGDFDTWWTRFIGGRFDVDGLNGRTKLLDLDYQPVEVASASLATALTAPTSAASQDSMLDMLLYLAGVPWPVDQNWTSAQRREFVRVGWDALRYKGTRKRLLKMMAGAMSGVVYGVSLPPWAFSFIHGDGSPAPGHGTWSTPPVLLAGTVSVTSGSATCAGVGTAFVTDGSWSGLVLLVGNTEHWISSVANATTLTLTANAPANAATQTARIVYSPSERPWLFEGTRNIVRRIFPGWAEQGVGYSQFRAGFSAAGEPVLATGSRVNVLLNEHFADFASATPDSWTATGAATLTRATANASPRPEINHEFTSYCAQLDLSAAAAGVSRYLDQTTDAIDNSVAHRVELDYSYTNSQSVDTLTIQVTDPDSPSLPYWPGAPTTQVGTVSIVEGSRVVTGTGTAFNTTGAWSGMPLLTGQNRTHLIERVVSATSLEVRDAPVFAETAVPFGVTAWVNAGTSISVPYRVSAASRGRLSFDVYPQRGSSSAAIIGTRRLKIKVGALSDGTATTQVVYTLYRLAVYERHDAVIEEQSTGERTLWLPLRDALGRSRIARTSSDYMATPIVAARGTVITRVPGAACFEHHPALGRHGFRGSSLWTNVLPETTNFSTWTVSGATYVAATSTPDVLGAVAGGGFTLSTLSSRADYAQLASASTAASKSWLHGVWARRNAAEPGFEAGTITITAGSTSVTGSGTSFADASGGWDGVDIMTAAGHRYTISVTIGAASATLTAVAGRTETAVQYKIADVAVSVLSGATIASTASHFLTLAEGWAYLPCKPVTLGVVAGNVGLRVRFPSTSTGPIDLFGAYLYDVTSKTDVLYPPVAISSAVSSTVTACYLDAITDNMGVDVKSELLKTSLASVSRGSLGLTVVPTFGAASQPNQTIIDICESTTANRLRLHVASTALTLTRVNAAGSSTSMSLALTTASTPTSAQVTWRRDEAIAIRVRWDDDGKASLSAGASNVAATLSASPYTDTAVDTLRIGASASADGHFDGIITDVEFIQVGTPTT